VDKERHEAMDKAEQANPAEKGNMSMIGADIVVTGNI
jgi:hypothetical protein